jgi:transposase-like protein
LAVGSSVCTGTQEALRPTNKSYRIDETYIRIKGQDRARTSTLYRAVDSTGQTVEFLLTAKRDAAAATRFLVKAIEASGNVKGHER